MVQKQVEAGQKKYDGKVDTKILIKATKMQFKDDQLTLYSGIVYSISLES